MRTLTFVLRLVLLPAMSWALMAAAESAGPHPAAAKQKKVIEFGWDEPSTAFLHDHIEEMERTPFDGCVFHVDFQDEKGSPASLTWQSWGTRPFSEEQLKPAINDLRSTRFHRFTHNFLRFNTSPAQLDWFDDYSAVLHNARLAALVARQGKCAGLLFDIEQYEGPLFDYRKQRDREAKSWELYAAQARSRGREVMQAFQEAFPDLTIFLTFGYSLPWHESRSGKLALAECHYGLLAPFLDGLVEAARGHSRIIDGNELAYGYREATRFAASYATMSQGLLPIVAQPAKYLSVFSFGFGLWMDNDWRKTGWNTEDFSKNHFTPETFAQSLREALARTDEYVWIYTETPRWWSADGPVKLPEAYAKATREAQKLQSH